MNRGAPLRRTAPLESRAVLKPGRPLARTALRSRARGRQEAVRSTSRSAADFPPAVKLAIRARAGGGDPDQACCEACGKPLGRYGGEIQHIVARGRGGRHGAMARLIRSIVNGCLLCGSALRRDGCHGLCEKRDPEMKRRGFWRPLNEIPGTHPLEMHGQDGGFTRWLSPDGLYSEHPPAGAA